VIKGSGRKPEEFNKLINEWEKSKDKMDALSKNIRSGKNPFSGLM
jgi:signal recognition particle GTPase